MKFSIPAVMALAAWCWPLASQAGEVERFYTLLNQFRSAPQVCDGRPSGASPEVESSPVLERVAALRAKGKSLSSALEEAGSQAEEADLLVVSGKTADIWLKRLSERYCRELRAPGSTQAGAVYARQQLFLVLASHAGEDGQTQPENDGKGTTDAQEQPQAASELTDLINDARHLSHQCGAQGFAPAGNIRWNDRLAAAAREHAEDMAKRRYFAHEAPEGGSVDERVTAAGYRWRAVGENIALAPGDSRRVVDLWMHSPGHCANIMSADFTEIGAAFAGPKNTRSNGYWVLVFASPRR